MSNIEKIKAEIENSIKAFEFNGGIYDSYEAGKLSAYKETLDFINSMPEESCKDSLQVQETCKENQDSFTSLEEAAEDSWVLYEYRETPQGLYSSCYQDGFIAGAKWALNQGVKATGMISPRGIIYDNNIGYRLFLERYHNGDKVEVQIRKIEENGK